jgi:ATP-dependent helicase/nuclease subunit B
LILTRENIASVDVDFIINQKITSGKAHELLLIVPTNRKARTVKKEIISTVPSKAAFGLNIETLGTISAKLLGEVKTFKQLSEAAATVFIKQCASEIELKYLSHYKGEIPFGTLDKIKNVISEYKRQGISSDVLRKEAGQLEKAELKKALDIAEIYGRFQKRGSALNAFELGDVYRELNLVPEQEFSNLVKNVYREIDLIVINGFSEFTSPEIEIIRKLSFTAGVKTFISFDYNLSNDQLFSHLDRCYEKLETAGFKKVTDKSFSIQNEFISSVTENLFRWRGFKKSGRFSTKIFEIAARDREKEVEVIAKEIKRLVIKEKVEPHKISVVFNLIQNYSSLVKDIFVKNGLPFNLTDRTPLDNSNPVTALVNFLEIVENNFYFKNIFRALSSKFIEVPGIDVSNLMRVSSELNIVAGKENWINSISDAIKNCNFGRNDDIDSELKLAANKKALKDVMQLISLLKPFEEKIAIKDFIELLKDFIVKSRLASKLIEVETGQEENVRAVTEFFETVSEIFTLLGEENGSEKKYPLNFFMDQIRTASSWARFNVKEKYNYGVQVTNLEEIRGLNFDYLFISGLIDGDFPTRYNPEIFLSGSFKKKAHLHQLEERYKFYQALCSWKKRLYLSFPQTESSRETVTSTFLDDFKNIFEVSSVDTEEYKNAIFCLEDLQIQLGETDAETLDLSTGLENQMWFRRMNEALQVERIRTDDPFGDSPYTGNLFAERKIDAKKLEEKLKQFSKRQYSISQLEIYAKCPFKFFIEKVLGIEAVEEPTEDIEAIEMGRLLHAILYEFYSAVRKKNIVLAGCNNDILKEAEEILFDEAEKQIKTTAFKSPLTFYEKEKILGLGGNRHESILYRFLEEELKAEEDFPPKYFEVSFGKILESSSDEILSDSEPVKIDQINLRGKIDRIEVNEKLKSFNVVDYKLNGSKPSFDDLKNGISLQLPVYLFAAAELLSKKFGVKYSPNEMFIYSLKYTLDEFGRKPVKTKGNKGDEIQSASQLIDKTLEHIKNYIRQLSKGEFGLSENENRETIVCSYCQSRKICRIDDL